MRDTFAVLCQAVAVSFGISVVSVDSVLFSAIYLSDLVFYGFVVVGVFDAE